MKTVQPLPVCSALKNYTHPVYILITLSSIKLHLNGMQTTHSLTLHLNASMWTVAKARTGSNLENIFIHFHQCSRMTNKTSTETDKHGVALHYTSQGQLRSRHLGNGNKTTFRAKRILAELLCRLMWGFVSARVVIWQAQGRDFLWSTEISTYGLLCGQLLWYTATCWIGGSCTAAGSGKSFKYLVWYCVSMLTVAPEPVFILGLFHCQPLPGENLSSQHSDLKNPYKQGLNCFFLSII